MNEQLIIRRAEKKDLPRLTDIYNYYILNSCITFDIDPWTIEQRAAWFEKHIGSSIYHLFVAEIAGEVAGYISSSQFREKAAFDSSVEISIYLAREYIGQGISRPLYAKLFEELKETGIHRAYAVITMPNINSCILHEKLGFKTVGLMNEVGYKFGRYWDVAWLEKKL